MKTPSLTTLTLIVMSTFACLPVHAEESWDASFSGALQADAGLFAPQRLYGQRSEQDLRRARLALRLTRDRFRLVIDRDLFNDSWADIAASFDLDGTQGIRIGHFRPDFGLEEMDSSRRRLLMEGALVNSAAPGRRWGVAWSSTAGPWSVTANGFGDRIDGSQRGLGLGVRVVNGRQWGDQRALHLAAAVQYEQVDGKLSLSTRTGTRLNNLRALSSGSLGDVSSLSRYGVEALYLNGPLSLQSELIHWRDDAAHHFNGAYLQAGWWLNGEHRAYREGQLQALKVAQGQVAWQLSARIEQVYLKAATFSFDRQSALTLGISAHIGPHWRLMGEAVSTRLSGAAADEHLHVLQARAQYAF